MRKARVLASAVVAVALGACTYDVPNVVARSDDAGALSGDGASFSGDASTSGADAAGSSSGGSGSSGSGSGSGGVGDAAGSTNDAPCSGVLCACNVASDCATQVCAQSQSVGSSLLAAAGGKPFCSRPCCTSADCDPGTVCFASGQGGSYCVSPAWLSRSAPGSAPGGSACSTNGQCRSGLCSAGACADTCCSLAASSQECVNGAQCTFANFPGAGFDTHFTGRCAAPPPATGYEVGMACQVDSDCKGGVCAIEPTFNACAAPCRSSAECGNGYACLFYEESGSTDIELACLPWGVTADQGAPCTTNTDCRGDWCNSTRRCSGPCVTDADCTVPGWHCTPQVNGPYQSLGCAP
jgi:hypothetical protein